MKKKLIRMMCFLSPVLVLSMFFIVDAFSPAIGEAKGISPKGEVVYVSDQNSFEFQKAFDPHTSMGSSTCRTLTSMVFDSLVTKDSKGDFQPALAESWEIAKDLSSITFTLRRNVKFHNGAPFSAKDVKFSIERLMRDDLKFVYRAELKTSISNVEVLDDYTVRIHLKHPYPAFFDRCGGGSVAILPKDYIEKAGDEGFAAKPVGAGPFRVVKFERNVWCDLEAVENHYRKTPHVKKLRLMVVPEASTRLAMLKTGEADFILAAVSQLPPITDDPDLRIIWSKHTYAISLNFNDLVHPEESPFKNPLVRRATSLAIDRKAIADVFHGTMEPWGSFLAPYQIGYDPKFNKPDPYNPAEAKKLLAQAGYPNGFDTELVYSTTQREIFEAIQPYLQEVGIRCKLSLLEYGTWASTHVAAKLRGLSYNPGPWWSGITHPAASLYGQILGSWCHKLTTPEIIEGLKKLEEAVGEENIVNAARKLDRTMVDANVRAILFSAHKPYGVGKRVVEYPGVPGVVHPLGFEYLKLADK